MRKFLTNLLLFILLLGGAFLVVCLGEWLDFRAVDQVLYFTDIM